MEIKTYKVPHGFLRVYRGPDGNSLECYREIHDFIAVEWMSLWSARGVTEEEILYARGVPSSYEVMESLAGKIRRTMSCETI